MTEDIVTEENLRGVWVRQYLSDIRFFERMPKLMLPLRVNSLLLAHSKRNFLRWGEAIWYGFSLNFTKMCPFETV